MKYIKRALIYGAMAIPFQIAGQVVAHYSNVQISHGAWTIVGIAAIMYCGACDWVSGIERD